MGKLVYLSIWNELPSLLTRKVSKLSGNSIKFLTIIVPAATLHALVDWVRLFQKRNYIKFLKTLQLLHLSINVVDIRRKIWICGINDFFYSFCFHTQIICCLRYLFESCSNLNYSISKSRCTWSSKRLISNKLFSNLCSIQPRNSLFRWIKK